MRRSNEARTSVSDSKRERMHNTLPVSAAFTLGDRKLIWLSRLRSCRKGKPLREFVPQLLQFQRKCKDAGVEIPFLFHCGETPDIGAETDGNLLDALLLGAKRIGHGFALSRHPYIMERMKERGVCLEICPNSNEILVLTSRISGHSVYSFSANNVHCTINSDNATTFR